jgi:hypothetical protein
MVAVSMPIIPIVAVILVVLVVAVAFAYHRNHG